MSLTPDQVLEHLRAALAPVKNLDAFEVIVEEKKNESFKVLNQCLVQNQVDFRTEVFVCVGHERKLKWGVTTDLDPNSLAEFARSLCDSVELGTPLSRTIRPLKFDSAQLMPKKTNTMQTAGEAEMVQRLVNLLHSLQSSEPRISQESWVALQNASIRTWQWSSGSKKPLNSSQRSYILEAELRVRDSPAGPYRIKTSETEFLDIDWSGFSKTLLSAVDMSPTRRALETGTYQVSFLSVTVPRLLAAFFEVLSGAGLMSGTGLPVELLGQKITSENLNIYDDPHMSKRPGTKFWDREGTLTGRVDFIKDGIFLSHAHSHVTADIYKSKTTGHAAGYNGIFGVGISFHNLVLDPGNKDKIDILNSVPKLLLVNQIHALDNRGWKKGGLSILASGIWLEGGKQIYGLQPFWISTSWSELFASVYVSRELWWQDGVAAPTILCENVTVMGTT